MKIVKRILKWTLDFLRKSCERFTQSDSEDFEKFKMHLIQSAPEHLDLREVISGPLQTRGSSCQSLVLSGRGAARPQKFQNFDMLFIICTSSLVELL